MQDPTDHLSLPGRTLLRLNPAAYRDLVVRGPGLVQAKDIPESLKPQDLVVGPTARLDEAAAMLAGLWLWHDWLDESHRIVQGIETETGSFWHAIMHRREGDFSNSKYWLARCASHPALATIAAQAGAVAHAMPADKAVLRVVIKGWDPS